MDFVLTENVAWLGTFLHEKLLGEQLFLLNVVHRWEKLVKMTLKENFSSFVIHGIKQWLDARKQPLASFVLSFINCYIRKQVKKSDKGVTVEFRWPVVSTNSWLVKSGILVNFLCNQPPAGGFVNDQLNIAIVLLWWTINFVAPSFYDFLFTNRLTLAILLFLKELLRCRKIYMAMEKGYGAYNGHLLLTAFIGTCGPCGGGFIKQVQKLIEMYVRVKIHFSQWPWQGWAPSAHLIRALQRKVLCSRPFHDYDFSATKCSAFFSVLYTLEKSGVLVKLWNTATRPQIILIQTLFMFSQAVSFWSLNSKKPFFLVFSQMWIQVRSLCSSGKSSVRSFLFNGPWSDADWEESREKVEKIKEKRLKLINHDWPCASWFQVFTQLQQRCSYYQIHFPVFLGV